jgi:hypothetical protein
MGRLVNNQRLLEPIGNIPPAEANRPWLTALLVRRPIKVAAIALANKIARMAWTMMAKGERYRRVD